MTPGVGDLAIQGVLLSGRGRVRLRQWRQWVRVASDRSLDKKMDAELCTMQTAVDDRGEMTGVIGFPSVGWAALRDAMRQRQGEARRGEEGDEAPLSGTRMGWNGTTCGSCVRASRQPSQDVEWDGIGWV